MSGIEMNDDRAAEALREAARRFIDDMADAWGGDAQWLTTGTRVAEVVACVLREMAAGLRLAENLANDAALVRLAQSEALRTAARTFVTEMGDTWGGDSQWLTTGTRVAEVVACVLREMAADLENEGGLTPPPSCCPTCIHPEGYDRLSGPCPTCSGDVVFPPGERP